jgi:monoamine oxidase
LLRTPLFRSLQRSFRLARLAAETGRPADEVVEIGRESSGLTRRQLLGGGGAAAGLALVGCRPFAPPPPRQARSGGGLRVVIVGAGIAGLTAGYRLHRQGASVRVFEGQDRIGGRMYSQRGFFPAERAGLPDRLRTAV